MQKQDANLPVYPSPFNFRTLPNLALRGIEADFGPEHAGTFRRDLHPDLRSLRHIETTTSAAAVVASGHCVIPSIDP